MGTRSSTRATAAKEKAYAYVCLTRDKPKVKIIDRPLHYSAGIRLSFGNVQNILIYLIIGVAWKRLKEILKKLG